MSNLGLELALREQGLQFVRAKVGDRYVRELMETQAWNLGGESSGTYHLLRRDHNRATASSPPCRCCWPLATCSVPCATSLPMCRCSRRHDQCARRARRRSQ
jgi:hypothetical protein